jgi:hypothetical protein
LLLLNRKKNEPRCQKLGAVTDLISQSPWEFRLAGFLKSNPTFRLPGCGWSIDRKVVALRSEDFWFLVPLCGITEPKRRQKP